MVTFNLNFRKSLPVLPFVVNQGRAMKLALKLPFSQARWPVVTLRWETACMIHEIKKCLSQAMGGLLWAEIETCDPLFNIS